MKPKTICFNCQKEWEPERWQSHVSICGVCIKEFTTWLEKQFPTKLVRKIRTEEDGA